LIFVGDAQDDSSLRHLASKETNGDYGGFDMVKDDEDEVFRNRR